MLAALLHVLSRWLEEIAIIEAGSSGLHRLNVLFKAQLRSSPTGALNFGCGLAGCSIFPFARMLGV